MIVDFAVTEVSARSIVPHFSYERFRGKGAGKILMNLIQIVSNMLSNGVKYMFMLKYIEQLKSFYGTIGFIEIYKALKWSQIQKVIDHYDLIKATIPLKTYTLNSKAMIDHKMKTFINHVEQCIDYVNLAEPFKGSFVPDIFDIFTSQNTCNKMIESCIKYNTNLDVLFIPVGKIIQHLFEKNKPSGYENFFIKFG